MHTKSTKLFAQNCLQFLKQVSVSIVRLQKRNLGRKQQINFCPKLGFDACNFGQFSIKITTILQRYIIMEITVVQLQEQV